MATGNTTLQLTADPQFRGRVMALWSVTFTGSTPVGGPIISGLRRPGAPVRPRARRARLRGGHPARHARPHPYATRRPVRPAAPRTQLARLPASPRNPRIAGPAVTLNASPGSDRRPGPCCLCPGDVAAVCSVPAGYGWYRLAMVGTGWLWLVPAGYSIVTSMYPMVIAMAMVALAASRGASTGLPAEWG